MAPKRPVQRRVPLTWVRMRTRDHLAVALFLAALSLTSAHAQTASAPSIQPPASPAASPNQPRFYIEDFEVKGGANLLTARQIENAVYPFMGPYRTPDDVDHAVSALQKAYHDQGFQAVTVEISQQAPGDVQRGIITLEVQTNPVGRVRVHGSRYYSINQIKHEAPALRQGTVLDFGSVTKNIIVLNQLQDRSIQPQLKTGIEPGTVDVDLNVKDTPPLHGSLELNNRYSAFTSPLRLNGSADYDNLWQLGHTIGFSFQVAPENLNEVEVFSGYYLARVPGLDWLSLEVEGTSQNSNVSTLGGIAVAGRGSVIGARAIISLPPEKDFYQSVSLGFDYKNFTQDTPSLSTAAIPGLAPITYFPFSVAYSGAWSEKTFQTGLDISLDFATRGLGSTEDQFDFVRHGASGNFIYIRGDLSHSHDLPLGFQVFGKVQGQAASGPLVSSEQFSAGGLDTVRGYLESEELGDNALFGTLEIRTPSLGTFLGKTVDDWRFYAFGDAGFVTTDQPLPEQTPQYDLLSFGAGTRIKLLNHYNGSLDFAVPAISATQTKAYSPQLIFRLWAEF